MLDTVQVVLLLVIVSLAILLLILGVQVFFILRELRRTVTKANKVLDNTGSITQSVASPLALISSLVENASTGVLFSKLVKIVVKAITRQENKEEKKDGNAK
jgi:predicted permease